MGRVLKTGYGLIMGIVLLFMALTLVACSNEAPPAEDSSSVSQEAPSLSAEPSPEPTGEPITVEAAVPGVSSVPVLSSVEYENAPGSGKIEFTRDDRGLLLAQHETYQSSGGQSGEIDYRYTLDDQGFITEEEISQGDTTVVWDYRHELLGAPDGFDLVDHITQPEDAERSAGVATTHGADVYQLSGEGILNTVISSSSYDDGSQSEGRYYYDASGLLTAIGSYNWDAEGALEVDSFEAHLSYLAGDEGDVLEVSYENADGAAVTERFRMSLGEGGLIDSLESIDGPQLTMRFHYETVNAPSLPAYCHGIDEFGSVLARLLQS